MKHTTFQLIRIYPHAVNQLSQNYDPIMPWANGCQVGTVFLSGKMDGLQGLTVEETVGLTISADR